MKVNIEIAYSSVTGMVRGVNEDSYCVISNPPLHPNIDAILAVADGVGGNQAGQVASKYAMESLYQFFSIGIVDNQRKNNHIAHR